MCLCLQSSCPSTSTLMAAQLLTRYSAAPRCGRWECHSRKDEWNFLPTGFQQACVPSTAFWIKVNIQGINSLIHLTPESYWYQRTAVGKKLTRCCCITQVWTKDLGLSQYTLKTCLELGISSPSDFSSLSHEAVLCPFRSLWNPIRCPLCFCTDWFKGSINEINGNEYGTAKKKCFLTQHRNLLS